MILIQPFLKEFENKIAKANRNIKKTIEIGRNILTIIFFSRFLKIKKFLFDNIRNSFLEVEYSTLLLKNVQKSKKSVFFKTKIHFYINIINSSKLRYLTFHSNNDL